MTTRIINANVTLLELRLTRYLFGDVEVTPSSEQHLLPPHCFVWFLCKGIVFICLELFASLPFASL